MFPDSLTPEVPEASDAEPNGCSAPYVTDLVRGWPQPSADAVGRLESLLRVAR